MNNQVGKHATTICEKDGIVEMIYHSTKIATYDRKNKILTLDSGGYKTVTTKRRITEFANHYNLAIKLYQKGGSWFVDSVCPSADPSFGTLDFFDNMKIKL